MKKKQINKRKFIYMITFFLLVIVFLYNNIYGATNPTLVTKLNSAFKKILKYLQTIAIPIAGVAIASGVLMRKLSFGDDEKMLKGKKIIINAIIGYAIIMSIDLIIKFIDSLI